MWLPAKVGIWSSLSPAFPSQGWLFLEDKENVEILVLLYGVGVYQIVQKEKVKDILSFFLVALVLLFIAVNLMGFECLDSKANAIILLQADLREAFTSTMYLFFSMENGMIIEPPCCILKLLQELAEWKT